jgi:hypothetical protein
MLTVVNLIIGAGLLTAGRKLFWLFIAAVGFVAGSQLAVLSWDGAEWMSIAAGIALGLICAGLALFFKSLAIGVAGFLGGGSILLSLAGFVGLDSGVIAWGIFFIGGLIGIALLTQLFDWAIIFISSIGGATLITQSLGLKDILGGMGFLVLVGIGVAIQARALGEERKNG